MSYESVDYELAPDLAIDLKKCLFLDNEYISEVKNLRRVFHSPRKHPNNPLIVQDKPWERAVWFHVSNFSVVFDTLDGMFKCFYEDQLPHSDPTQHWLFDLHARSRVLLATSKDGLTWDKPLNGMTIDGQRTNVVIEGGIHSASVLCDPIDTDPAKRFKMLYTSVGRNANIPKTNRSPSPHGNGLHAAYSGDGWSWTPAQDNPILPWGDDVTILTFDPVDRKYTIMGRADNPHVSSHPDLDLFFLPFRPSQRPGQWVPKRHVYRLTSDDFVSWTVPNLVMAPDHTDNLDDEHYGLVPWRVDDYHLGLLSVLHTVPNTVDLELVYSRDGVHWRRFVERSAVIPLGGPGSYDRYMADCTSPPITVGDEQWIFYGGSKRHHDFWVEPPPGMEPEGVAGMLHLALATIRTDGWVSLSATERDGYVETTPVFSTGSRILINARCGPGGYVACELRDYWGNVWEGFEKDNAEAFTGDAIAHPVSWVGNPAVNTVPSNVRVRFYLRNADLYSFRFAT